MKKSVLILSLSMISISAYSENITNDAFAKEAYPSLCRLGAKLAMNARQDGKSLSEANAKLEATAMIFEQKGFPKSRLTLINQYWSIFLNGAYKSPILDSQTEKDNAIEKHGVTAQETCTQVVNQ